MSAAREYIAIVSGLPRSGTSMMMQMLDKAGIPVLTDNIRVADADNPKGYYEFEAVKRTRKDASWVKQAPGKVVKMVHLLLLDLPLNREYRVVFMKRHLEEVVKSQNIMLDRHGKEWAEADREKVIKAFQAQMKQVDKWMAGHDCFKALYVDYNEIMRDPEPVVRAINAFLGGDLNTGAMMEVVDPSLYRNRAAGKAAGGKSETAS
ncbi:MAG TPA: sulfotransferase [Phycisphaerae bacterium]|nr:sulfotransferase [Phycisphaerae bacterium]